MVDACTIVRPSGDGLGTYNPTTLTYGANTGTSLYSGKCRLRRNSEADSHDEAAEKPVGFGEHVVTIPVSSITPRLDDLVTITASALDPALVGLVLIVQSVTKGTHVTARRMICAEVTV